MCIVACDRHTWFCYEALLIFIKMKTFKIFILLLVAATGIAKAQFTKAELQLSGLNCGLCARATQNALKALPYIAEVKPDLMRNLFVITFKDGANVNFDEMGKKIKDAGFFVNSLKATFNFDNVKVDNNSFRYGADTFQLMNPGKALVGPVAVTLVDKGFATRSVYKKYLGSLAASEPATPGRLYHVAI